MTITVSVEKVQTYDSPCDNLSHLVIVFIPWIYFSVYLLWLLCGQLISASEDNDGFLRPSLTRQAQQMGSQSLEEQVTGHKHTRRRKMTDSTAKYR